MREVTLGLQIKMERGGIAIMIEGKRIALVKKTKSIGNNGELANKEERRMDNVKTREFTRPCLEL